MTHEMERVLEYRSLAKMAADLARESEQMVAFKPAEKHAAILRILRDGDGTVTSYTAAEKQVETEPEYAAYLNRMLDAQRDTLYAIAKARAAELSAQLAVKHSLGVEA